MESGFKMEKLNSSDWERTGSYETFDNCEGFFDTFYNEESEETLHVWHAPEGAVKLLDEDLNYEYDKEDLDNEEEIDNCHELMAVL